MRKFIRFEISYGQTEEGAPPHQEQVPTLRKLVGTGLVTGLLRLLSRAAGGGGGAPDLSA
ncbi:hypothetical protein SAMN05421508_10318 [Caenispirillum bisanense]|uniref:Uncharacterized protein n=1 Tax=Caenispirillum bisanense TaxID=414052 RepID=A0A286GE54_9PROT|nr:hypothetical protein SAMN05421508_10318 [Caenispirillum bisanense]